MKTKEQLTKALRNYIPAPRRTLCMTTQFPGLTRSIQKSAPLTALTLALTAIVANPASAEKEGGGWSSGGGNGVVCFSSPQTADSIRKNGGIIPDSALKEITSIEAYDLYEARAPRGFEARPAQIIQTFRNESPRAYVERMAIRMEPNVPWIADLIRQGSEVFSDARIIVHPSAIGQKMDMANIDELTDPKCVISTLATQTTQGNKSYLHLDGRLMKHSAQSPLSKSVLFLHEVLYRHAILVGQTDSRNTRHMVAEVISRYPGQTVATLIDSAKALGFISTQEPKVYQLDSKDPLTQLRGLVAITEVDELSLEVNEDAHAHKVLARMMTPVRLEALRIFDQYQAEHAADSEQLTTMLNRITKQVRHECNDVSVCIEILTRIAKFAVRENKVDLGPAREFLRKRKEAIRSQLRTWVDTVSAQSMAQAELLPEETRAQMRT